VAFVPVGIAAEWLNLPGFFADRWAAASNSSEVDILAVRLGGAGPDLRRCRVRASVNPKGRICSRRARGCHRPRTLFDACVLCPVPLRDLLAHMAKANLFLPAWPDSCRACQIPAGLAR